MQLDFSLFSQFSEKTEAYIFYLYAVQHGIVQCGVEWCTSVLQEMVWSGVGQCYSEMWCNMQCGTICAL